ncbi:MAG: chloride channel protein [Coriobacteriales bacterium]|nr:chloride channel protein [Coriobacteriales bacterium]
MAVQRPKLGRRSKRHAKQQADPKARTYVGDVIPRDGMGASGKATMTLGFVLLSLAVGFVIGFAVFLVMNLSTWLTNLLWTGLGGRIGVWWFPLVTCTIGGAVIGVWTHLTHDRVHSLKEVMVEFKQTGSYKVRGVVRPVVSFLLPLVFGGSIGFEAGLTGLIVAGCCWIRDQLKRAGLRVASIADVSIAACLSAIFRAPLVGIAAGAEDTSVDVDGYDMRRGAKAVLYSAAAFGAFAGIRVCSVVFGVSGGLPRFEEITASATDFIWAVPCLALAYCMALLFHGSKRLFALAARRVGDNAVGTIAKPIICGMVLGAIACALPFVLFPGEAQSEELMESWTTMSALVLLLTGVLKVVATPLCLSMGWMGGDLFPSIFAGVSAGYGLAALTGADPMLLVTVTTAAFLAGVVRKPLIVLAILFLCFPADGIVWMGLATLIGATLPLPRALISE